MGKIYSEILDVNNKIKLAEEEFKTHFKGTDPETGALEWDVEYSPDLNSLYKDVDSIVRRLEKISKKLNAPKAEQILNLSKSLRNNLSRLLKQYNIDESSISQGIGYLTPKAFKNKNIYKYNSGYTKVPKKIKNSGLEVKKLYEGEFNEFQTDRINIFDKIEDELNALPPLISNAKNKTIEYYSANPGSFEIVNSTDLILSYIKDIKTLLKGEE